MARAIVGLLTYLLIIPAGLLLAGGDPTWPMGWIYTALYLAAGLGSRLLSWRLSPGMLRERAAALRATGVPAWDRALVLIVALVGPVAAVLVAGLDHRFGWPPAVSSPLQLVGLALVMAGYILGVWAMLVNPFFSSFVRIQSERGHQVIARGPYAVVRHPAYSGGILAALATPIMLDAVWALLPGTLIAMALVLRTYLEDQLLQDRLPGYREYASSVRARMIPGGW